MNFIELNDNLRLIANQVREEIFIAFDRDECIVHKPYIAKYFNSVFINNDCVNIIVNQKK